MDSLLEALKTGQAFSHKPRRKVPARGAAGQLTICVFSVISSINIIIKLIMMIIFLKYIILIDFFLS